MIVMHETHLRGDEVVIRSGRPTSKESASTNGVSLKSMGETAENFRKRSISAPNTNNVVVNDQPDLVVDRPEVSTSTATIKPTKAPAGKWQRGAQKK